jgi:hypothetical protein
MSLAELVENNLLPKAKSVELIDLTMACWLEEGKTANKIQTADIPLEQLMILEC